MQDEVILLDRAVESVLEHQRLCDAGIQLGLVEQNSLAGDLGFRKRSLGVLEQNIDVIAVKRIDGDPDRERNADLVVAHCKRSGECLRDVFF